MPGLRAGLLAIALLFAAPPVTAAPSLAHRTLRWEGTQVHALLVPRGFEVRPVVASPGRTVEAWARAQGAMAAINGGFFNHSDGFPVSHVRIDGEARTRPEANQALIGNPALRPILDRILDRRVEWRLLEGPSGPRWAIGAHLAPVRQGDRLVHALQAGPALLPAIDLIGEGFVSRDARGRINRDGIASGARAARSALGLTPAGDMWWVAAAGDPRAGTGLTIAQLAGLMRHLGADRAMALDGGGSTSLVWREGPAFRSFVGTGQGPARVNSALVALPAPGGKMGP
ncbi:MAG: phosphodiester glycosidase family protein [Candidatus Sericytochromatia bacterium]